MAIAIVTDKEIKIDYDRDNLSAENEYLIKPGYPLCDQRYYVISHAEYILNKESNVVEESWVYNPRPLHECLTKKYEELAQIRWEHEIGGMYFNDMPFPTDENTQNKLLAARVKCEMNPTTSFDWKTPVGFVNFSSLMIVALSDAVFEHIQGCFTAEKKHITAIESLRTSEEVIEYDIHSGWPGQEK